MYLALKHDVFVKHECPRHGHFFFFFLKKMTLIFDADLDRWPMYHQMCIDEICLHVPNMSLETKSGKERRLSFHDKFLHKVCADRWMDIRTTVKQYAPDLTLQGYKKRLKRHNWIKIPVFGINIFLLLIKISQICSRLNYIPSKDEKKS